MAHNPGYMDTDRIRSCDGKQTQRVLMFPADMSHKLLVHLQLDWLNLITGLHSKQRIAVFGLDSVLSSYYLALSAADK